jgi:hypothetical protein
MTARWIAIGAGGALAAGLVGMAIRGRGLRRARAAGGERARVLELGDATTLDRETGAVRSVQTADLVIDAAALQQLWTPEYLERLARTYWRFLARVTLGLVHVHYSEEERSVVLVAAPLKLLTFQAPDYEMDSTRGLVRWNIAHGLLVSRRGDANGRGYLQIEVIRQPDTNPRLVRLHVTVEVANFYPSIASGLSRRLYDATQSRIHVTVTHGFLRSLARLEFARSRVGRFEGG